MKFATPECLTRAAVGRQPRLRYRSRRTRPHGRVSARPNVGTSEFPLRPPCSSIGPRREEQPMPNSRSAGPSRRGVLGGAAAAASAVLAAPALVRAQAGAIKIAVLLPRSGYLAPSGQSCHRGALIAPQVLAQYGHRVELLHIDTESSVDVARTQTERAINEGAQCVVGAFEFGRDAGDGAGLRAAAGAARGQYRGGATIDRAGLEVPGAQFPDRRTAGGQRVGADQGPAAGHPARAQDGRLHPRQ